MQISIDIQDDIYQQLQKAGIDIQSRFNEYLASLAYKNTKKYEEDKAYFQQALEEVESGKAELLDEEQYEKEMKTFERSL